MTHENARFEAIETAVAHLDYRNGQMHEVLMELGRELQGLRGEIARLKQQLEQSATGAATSEALEEERPPHY
jgi:uncharacterized coiled-coil protein SlyX